MPALRRSLLVGALVLSAATAGAQSTGWTFVSIPDFQNNDIGSLADPQSNFPNVPTLPPGFVALDPRWDSCTANYDDSVDWIVGRLASEDPAFVTVAGDLVMGHWERSTDGRQVFGPLGSDPAARATIDRSADYYYDLWLGRFDPARNGYVAQALTALGRPQEPLTVHAVLGDHEIGDNNWPAGSLRSRMVPTYKQAFGRWFTTTPPGSRTGTPRYLERPIGTVYEDTAYAFQHRNLLVVVVDEFRQDDPATALGATGSVFGTVDDGRPGTANDDQLAWLDRVLAAGRADPSVGWIVVQGHMPVLRPVRTRNTSNLGVNDTDGATQFATRLWRTLSRHRVDAYFCGEVHDVSLSRYGGVTQVVHGALIGNHSPIHYLTVDVHPDRLELTSKTIQVQLASGSLWQTGSNRPRSDFDIPAATRTAGFQVSGHATLTRLPGGGSVVTRADGNLAPYGTFVNGDGEYLVDLDFDALVSGRFENAASIANHGTPEGNVTVTPGVLGQAITLGGAADRVVAGGAPIGGSRPRTVSVWARTGSVAGLRTVLTMGSNSPGGKWDLDVDCDNGGVLELGVGGGRTIGRGPRVNDGRWHLLTTVLPDGRTSLADVRLFVDGALAYTNAVNQARAIDTGGGDLIVGHAANAAFFQTFAGDVDDLVIWAEALSDAQVRSLHDVALEPTLAYAATEFEQLLEVWRQDVPEADVGGRIWRRVAGGLTGPPGLTVLPGGGYELVFDAQAGAGVRVVTPSRIDRFGAGCPGQGNRTPSMVAGGVPTLGNAFFSLQVFQARASSPAALLTGTARRDLSIGGGCVVHPSLPAIGAGTATDPSGFAFFRFAIPNDRALLGLTLTSQWTVVDAAGAFGPGIASFSNGVGWTIGDA